MRQCSQWCTPWRCCENTRQLDVALTVDTQVSMEEGIAVLIDRLNSFFKFGSNFDNTATSSNQLVPQSQVWLQILGELAEFSFEGIPLSFRIL